MSLAFHCQQEWELTVQMQETSCNKQDWSFKHQTHAADNLHTFADKRQKHLERNHIHPVKAGAHSVTCNNAHTYTNQNTSTFTCMHPMLVTQVQILQVAQAWRSSPGGLEVLGGRRSHYLSEAEQGGKSSREGWGGQCWWWWGGGCSQQKGILRMLSFNLKSASHTLFVSLSNSFFLPQLYLTSSGFCVSMWKGRRVSNRQRDGLKMQTSWAKTEEKVLQTLGLTHSLWLSHILYVCVDM